MPPRKRSSTNTAANGPSKRAKATEEERTPPDAEVSPSGSSTDGSVEPTPEASASETIGPDANVPETNNPDASATAPPRSARQVPRPARFSEVSATANTWQHWRHFVAKDPAHAYTFACLCRLPHHRVFEELDPFEEVDPEEQQEEEDDEERGVCNGGETCICEKPASERPGHKWVLSRAGFRLLALQHILTARTGLGYTLLMTTGRLGRWRLWRICWWTLMGLRRGGGIGGRFARRWCCISLDMRLRRCSCESLTPRLFSLL